MQGKNFKETIGKPRISLVPPALIEGVASVRTWETETKCRDSENWRQVPPAEYLDAIGRHMLACLRHGPDALDPESGLPHMAHIACNAAFLLEISEMEQREARRIAGDDDDDFDDFVAMIGAFQAGAIEDVRQRCVEHLKQHGGGIGDLCSWRKCAECPHEIKDACLSQQAELCGEDLEEFGIIVSHDKNAEDDKQRRACEAADTHRQEQESRLRVESENAAELKARQLRAQWRVISYDTKPEDGESFRAAIAALNDRANIAEHAVRIFARHGAKDCCPVCDGCRVDADRGKKCSEHIYDTAMKRAAEELAKLGEVAPS